ncbi:MAG: hypothetical protein AAGA73_19440 [Pseudomonadota bacterium]
MIDALVQDTCFLSIPVLDDQHSRAGSPGTSIALSKAKAIIAGHRGWSGVIT